MTNANNSSALAQPAAPTPPAGRLHAEFCYPVCHGDCPWSQPAAPEPSADKSDLHDHPDLLTPSQALLAEQMSHDRTCTMLNARLRAAEAQLAAVQQLAEQRKQAWLAACAKLESARDVLRLARAAGCVPALVCAQFDACLQPDSTPLAEAEARLAAALSLLAEISESSNTGRSWRGAIRPMLTATPSPGAKEGA